MSPREITDTIMRKYENDIICIPSREGRRRALQHAVMEAQSLCTSAEESRSGPPSPQTIRIINIPRHT